MTGEPSVIPSAMILIDKPADRRITSMTVCRAVKKRLLAGGITDSNRKKGLRVGHAGTLDPLASGLLIVLIGKATRLCGPLMLGEKVYETSIDLGRASTTDDLEGQLTDNFGAIMAAGGGEAPSRQRVDEILARFVGTILQTPPAYSAMWVDGERAYDLARAGETVKLEPRPVAVHQIDVVEYAFPHLRLSIRCGKGTYIRSLARDIGIALTGYAGSLTSLRRTAIGPYRVEDAVRLGDLPPALTLADLEAV